jgi:hypothetical protein
MQVGGDRGHGSIGNINVYSTRFRLANVKGRYSWKTALDWRIILKLIVMDIGCEGLDRINVAKDKNQWRYRANTIINLGVLQKVRNF